MTLLFVSAGVLAVLKTVKRTPSNRTMPACVASHRYPSVVWAMALIEFCGSPFSISQAEWVNCVRAFAGSRASASACHSEASAMQAAVFRMIFTR